MRVRKKLRVMRWLLLLQIILILKTVTIVYFKLNHFKTSKTYTTKYIPNQTKSSSLSSGSILNSSTSFLRYSHSDLYNSSNNVTVPIDCGPHIACPDDKTCCPNENTCCWNNGVMQCCPAGTDVSYMLRQSCNYS